MDTATHVRLVNAIDRFYEQYRNRQATIACIFAIGAGLVAAVVVYLFFPALTALVLGFGFTFIAALAFLLVALLPESRMIESVQSLMEYALEHPRAVELCEGGRRIRIRRDNQATDFAGVHAQCWMKCVELNLEKPSSVLSGSYKAMIRMEETLREREQELSTLKERLTADAENIEERSQFLANSEEELMNRLHGFAEREAQLDQMKEDLRTRSNAPFADGSGAMRNAELEKRERQISEMKRALEKEAAQLDSEKQGLEQLRSELAADQSAYNAGIADFSEALGGIETSLPADERAAIAASEGDASGINEKELELEALKQRLVSEAAQLEMRSKAITETENALIDRLNDLDVREVALEQRSEDLSSSRSDP